MPSNERAPRRSDPSRLPPGTVLNAGKYRVLSLLASGGMGHVYVAEQSPLGRKVALKVLRTPEANDPDADVEDQFRKRFFREASILAHLQHVNVVTLYDYGRIDGEPERYFMAMEYLDGPTLSQRLRERGALPAQEALRILRQMARGLREAHKLGAVHRDLKPSNVMLVPEEDGGEVVKILDFGIGKLLGGPEEQELTQEGVFLGSPKYVAPEQVNERRVDSRTDVYSLGVIAYECFTGVVPFVKDTNLELILAHCSAPVPPMAERAPGVQVPPIVEAFVRRCLEKSPMDRPQGMEEVLRGIGECEQALFGRPSLGAASSGSVPSVSPASGPTPAAPEPDTLSSNLRIEVPESVAARPAGSTGTHATVTRTRPPPAPEAEGRSRMPLVLGAVAAALLAAGVVTVRQVTRARDDASPPAGVFAATSTETPAPTASAATAQPRSFMLVIDSTPQGADVLDGDQVLGATPLQLSIDRASVQAAPRRFVLRLDGYTPYTLLQGDSTTPVQVIAPLVAEAPAHHAAPAPAPRPAAARPAAPKPAAHPDTDIKLTR